MCIDILCWIRSQLPSCILIETERIIGNTFPHQLMVVVLLRSTPHKYGGVPVVNGLSFPMSFASPYILILLILKGVENGVKTATAPTCLHWHHIVHDDCNGLLHCAGDPLHRANDFVTATAPKVFTNKYINIILLLRAVIKF